MSIKELFSSLAILITMVAFAPYIRSIIQGSTKPHVFSWVIWGLTTLLVFLAQLEAKGGIGAWPIGLSGCITIVIALLAYLKKADNSITRTDWVFFVLALSSLPVWYVTSDPLWSVIILTVVDLMGFAPTFRKSFYKPHSESIMFFWVICRA